MVQGILILCTFRTLGTDIGAALLAGQATRLLTSQLLTSRHWRPRLRPHEAAETT
jgi:hypothetical protein